MKREDIVRLLAPVAPPCFETRDVWVSYCQSAADEQREGHVPGPLVFTAGTVTVREGDDLSDEKGVLRSGAVPVLIFATEQVTFNPLFDYCEECTLEHQNEMSRQRRCDPDYVRVRLEE